jgi:ATP-binding cassette, subfamily C, type I secretion system permease/ATPase
MSSLEPTPLANAVRAVAPALVTSLVFSFFINLLTLVSPIYMLQVYDRVVATRDIDTLVAITVIAVGLLVVYALLQALRTRVLVRAGLLFDRRLADDTFEAVHRGLLRQPNGGWLQVLRDIDVLREFLSGAGLIAFFDAPWFPIFVGAAFLLHSWFGWLAIIGGLVIFALALANELLTKRQLEGANQASMRASRSAYAIFRNGEALEAMGMLSGLRRIWGEHHEAALKGQARASDRAGTTLSLTRFARTALQVGILGTGAYLAIRREISLGAIVAASILIGRALAPVEFAVAGWKGFVSARGAFARVRALFRFVGITPERMPLPPPHGALAVEDLGASAPGQQANFLHGISFRLEAGETLGIVGPNAAGKSSLIRVLVGVWPAAEGAVRLDGSSLAHWDRQRLGRHIGYLPQDVELFAGSVAQNIARFQEIDDQGVIAAAELAGCHELIQQLPDGYDTQIGEGGLILSGGQRQRIALARAVYGDPSLVVLDEPNSNLDTAGEEALIAALHRLKERGASLVVVTHRLNILATADKILVMDGGTVHAWGERDDILESLLGPRIVQTPAPQPAPARLAPTGQARGLKAHAER